MPAPRIVVFTTLFPSAGQPAAGLFIRERWPGLREAERRFVGCERAWPVTAVSYREVLYCFVSVAE